MGKIAHQIRQAPVDSGSRVLAVSDEYRVIDLICGLGPHDPVNENAFQSFRVAAFVRGSFAFRSTLGDGLPVAGSLLMGNARDGYACRHFAPGGDRCIAFDFDAGFLENVRMSLGLKGARDGFRRALLAPSVQSAAITSVTEVLVSQADPDALHEAALVMAAAGIAATHDTLSIGRKSSYSDERRISLAVRYIERHFEHPCTLKALAADAGMSPYHFLRVFRRTTGQTPHRYVLATRLRYAARRLAATTDRVIEIAGATGFGDVSNFNAAFVRAFGVSPTAFRARLCIKADSRGGSG